MDMCCVFRSLVNFGTRLDRLQPLCTIVMSDAVSAAAPSEMRKSSDGGKHPAVCTSIYLWAGERVFASRRRDRIGLGDSKPSSIGDFLLSPGPDLPQSV